jgi:hypothetical protein
MFSVLKITDVILLKTVKFHHVVYGFKAFVLPAVFASGA